MKHIKGFRQLNRNTAHRKALYKNMVEALLKNERICTTVPKAKEIRRIAEKLITKAKERTLHNIRNINKMIRDKEILMKLFDEIAPRYKERPGGYTRIIKLSRRKGDGAYMAYLELIEEQIATKKKKKKKKDVPKKISETKETATDIIETEEQVSQEVQEEKAEVKEETVDTTENKETEQKKEEAEDITVEEKTVVIDEAKETVEEKKEDTTKE